MVCACADYANIIRRIAFCVVETINTWAIWSKTYILSVSVYFKRNSKNRAMVRHNNIICCNCAFNTFLLCSISNISDNGGAPRLHIHTPTLSCFCFFSVLKLTPLSYFLFVFRFISESALTNSCRVRAETYFRGDDNRGHDDFSKKIGPRISPRAGIIRR